MSAFCWCSVYVDTTGRSHDLGCPFGMTQASEPWRPPDLLAAILDAYAAVRALPPFPTDIWVIDRGSWVSTVRQKLVEAGATVKDYADPSTLATGIPIYEWYRRHHQPEAPIPDVPLGDDGLPRPGVWIRMSDGNWIALKEALGMPS